jgi:integrase
MANRKVTLIRNCKTPKGWRRYEAAMGGNGRVKPGYALVKDKPAHFPEGHYEIRYYEGSQVKYINAGTDATQALAACAKHARLLIARDTAQEAGAVIVEEKGRTLLAQALAQFVQAAEDRGSKVSAVTYKRAAEEFLAVTGRRFADEVVAEDLLRYQRALRQRGCSPRTIYNRQVAASSFLRFAGVSQSAFPTRAPRFEKTLPEVYTGEELAAFFNSLEDESYRLTFSLALKCGLREQELMHLEWIDISFPTKTLLIRSKPKWGFEVKDKEERSIPIPSDLLALLEAHRSHAADNGLITRTSGNNPNQKLLRTLKRLVRAASLNCGTCSACVERGECERWFLHKFRSSYATALLRSGMDVRTVQQLMGHSDMESTMRYLRPQEDAAIQSRINSVVWG